MPVSARAASESTSRVEICVKLTTRVTWRVPDVRVPVLSNTTALGRASASREAGRSEEHTSELQSLMRISYAVLCLKKKTNTVQTQSRQDHNNHINSINTTKT